MSEPETTFENAKTGDRVYSPLFKSVNPDDKTNAIMSMQNGVYCCVVTPDIGDNVYCFKIDGSYSGALSGQVLFWENPIKEIPTRPKRKVMKKGYIGISPSCTNPGLIAVTNTDIFSERNMIYSGDNNQIVPIEFEVEE